MTGPHLRSIPAGTAPGVLYVRIVTDADQVLREGPLSSLEMSELYSMLDHAEATDWVERHPGARCYLYVYDGDDGQCIMTIVIDGSVDI